MQVLALFLYSFFCFVSGCFCCYFVLKHKGKKEILKLKDEQNKIKDKVREFENVVRCV